MIYVLRLQQQLPIEHEKNKIIYFNNLLYEAGGGPL